MASTSRNLMNDDDVLQAMERRGFENSARALRLYLQRYRAAMGVELAMALGGIDEILKKGSLRDWYHAGDEECGGEGPMRMRRPLFV